MSAKAASLKAAQDQVLLHYLDQLAVTRPKADAPRETKDKSNYLAWLQQLSTHFQTNISSAIAKLASGSTGSNLTSGDWADVGFFNFLESAAMYLRDEVKMDEAAEEHRQGHMARAMQLLRDATADISTLASQWGVKFTPLCDLLDDRASLGLVNISGPYCGAFYSTSSPFLGIAFKGTNAHSIAEWLVDANYAAEQEPDVWGSQVSKGPWSSLFKPFKLKDGTTEIAYDHILAGVGAVLPHIHSGPVPTHVTGHSLGASYATLCFARILSQSQSPVVTLPSQLTLSDLCTFGGPRIGYNDFSLALRNAMQNHKGRTWRVVNHNDPIPTVPPVYIPLATPKPFIHIDNGYNIFPDSNATAIPTEINGPTPKPGHFPLTKKGWEPHMGTAYVSSLVYNMTGKPLPDVLLYQKPESSDDMEEI